ncbi:MAG: PfkB family carbohydrate kinase [Phycisphaerae bacterium]
MSLLVTGSIGIDTVEAPWGSAEEVLGGSSVYFATAASLFTPVRLVGVVGEDCPVGFLKPLEDNPNIDLEGLEVRKGSKTFRWHGRYQDDANVRETINVELNVLGEDPPAIPEKFRDSRFVFLANTHPFLQKQLLEQVEPGAVSVADTMDLWIENEQDALMDLLGEIDGLVLNDFEARQLTGKTNLIIAGREIVRKVKHFVVIKKGEHGSILFIDDSVYPMPSYPATNVVDPTGAGDCFAGGMMGYLAEQGQLDAPTLRKAIAYGTVVAGIELEDFSLNKLSASTRDDVEERMGEFREMVHFWI